MDKSGGAYYDFVHFFLKYRIYLLANLSVFQRICRIDKIYAYGAPSRLTIEFLLFQSTENFLRRIILFWEKFQFPKILWIRGWHGFVWRFSSHRRKNFRWRIILGFRNSLVRVNLWIRSWERITVLSIFFLQVQNISFG